MGSLGNSSKDNDKEASKATKNAVASAQPRNYTDPYGSLTNSGNMTEFKPNESAAQIGTRNTIDDSIENIVGQVPTEFDIDSYYNNPFYENTKRMYTRVIDQQKERDARELDDNLNAKNQIGSSYDALRRRYFDQDYNTRYDQAEDQARGASATAYQQAYQNLLESLRGLSNERSAAQERAYAPAKIATGYQSAIAPLQNSQAAAYSQLAQYYGGRQTLGQNLFGLANSIIGATGQAAGAYYGA